MTKNIALLRLSPTLPAGAVTVVIDGHSINISADDRSAERELEFVAHDGTWSRRSGVERRQPPLLKRPGLQGPIDDAFLSRFLVVRPTKKSTHAAVQRWVDFELAHLQDRWRAVFRGELPIKNDTDLKPEDFADCHLILWGDADSNRVIRQIHEQLPLHWSGDELQLGDRRFAAASHVPVCIFPNPKNPRRYVVLNSGPTFREAHDRTNSLQNPKLPDWAILDISQPPDTNAAGRVAAAGFFDEIWNLPRQP